MRIRHHVNPLGLHFDEFRGARPHVQMWIRFVKGSDGKVTRSVSS